MLRFLVSAVFVLPWSGNPVSAAPAARPEPAKPESANPESVKSEMKPGAAAGAAGAVTPKQAVARLEAAVHAAQKDPAAVRDVLATFAEPLAGSLQTLFTLSGQIGQAQVRLDEAMDKKFGKDASSKRRLPDFGAYERNFRDGLAEVFRMEVQGDGEPQPDGRVLLTVKADVKSKAAGPPDTREEKYLAVKQADGTWRLLPAKLGDPKAVRLLQLQVEAFRKAPETLDRVSHDVAEGKYKTRQEAHQAAFSAFLSVLQALQQKSADQTP